MTPQMPARPAVEPTGFVLVPALTSTAVVSQTFLPTRGGMAPGRAVGCRLDAGGMGVGPPADAPVPRRGPPGAKGADH